MTYVLGTIVPAHGGLNEICHGFVFRWLRAKRLITGPDANIPNPDQLTAHQMHQLLFKPKGLSARSGRTIHVQSGCIIGFWSGPTLQHSMIALSSTNWIGANNTGCFGTAGGRGAIHDVDQWISNPPAMHFGWVGDDNEWQGQFQRLRVTFRLPPQKDYS